MKENNHRILTRRDFLRMAAVATTGALVTACGAATPAPGPEGAPAEQEVAAEAPAAEKVTLRLWSINNTAFVKANEGLIKKWQESNPNVEVKYENFPYADLIQTIQTSMAAKNEADVVEMFGSWVQSYA